MTKPWTREEFASLLTCLRRHTDIQESIRDHNSVWKTNRTRVSIEHKLLREGRGGFSNHLRIPAQRKEDLPISDQIKGLIEILRKKPSASVLELCNELNIAPKHLEQLVRTARSLEYRIEMPTNDRIALNVKAPPIDRLQVHRLPIEPIKGHIKFAVASDIHFASKLHRNECLKDFIDYAYEELGIRTVMDPGDIFAGMNMYHGQLNEVVGWGISNQLEEGIRGLPRKNGLTYHMIGGNHDESFMKASGSDIIKQFSKARSDIKAYGFYSALLDLYAPGAKKSIKLEMHHPDKAGAYALTYHLQRELDAMPPGLKPQIILMGHTHQCVLLPNYRNVAAFYCGTFEDQTLYLKRKHVAPHIGGWIVDIGVTNEGSIKSLSTTWINYFHSRRGPIIAEDLEHVGNTLRFDRSIGVPVGDAARPSK